MHGNQTTSQTEDEETELVPTKYALSDRQYEALHNEFRRDLVDLEPLDKNDLARELWVLLENPREMVKEARECRE